jgi:hypothetical protein
MNAQLDSKILLHRLAQSKALAQWFQDSGRSISFPAGLRSVLVGATIQIALEHHSAIVDLMEQWRPAPALALIRPLFEESTRSSWLLLGAASDEQLLRFANGKLKPGLEKMVRDVAKHHRDSSMFSIMKPVIDRMHGFTHGGVDQLQYRLRENKIAPLYPGSLLCDALQVSNLAATMAFLGGPALAPDIPLGDRLAAESRQFFGVDSSIDNP